MKVVIVTDYLNVYGGGERVVESLLEIYPDADVFTSLYDSSKFSKDSPISKVRVVDFSFFHLPFTHFFLKHLTLVMPFFFERLDLSDYDLVLSVGTIWAKGIKIDSNRQRQIFYCLTPPRFLYGYASETAKRNVWYFKPFVILIDHFLRLWDFRAAQRPDEIVSISHEVQARVKKFYRRDSKVIYPPVSTSTLRVGELDLHPQGGYFLIVSRLAAYKGIDVAIEACNRLKLPLKIVGTGREELRLRKLAGPTTEFLGFRSDEELATLYQNCRAVIFPTVDEDFGIVPVEANAFGKPVIAPRSGGVLETMVEGKTAIFFEPNSVESLVEVLRSFDESKFSPEDCFKNAQRFSQDRFQKEFHELVVQFHPQGGTVENTALG